MGRLAPHVRSLPGHNPDSVGTKTWEDNETRCDFGGSQRYFRKRCFRGNRLQVQDGVASGLRRRHSSSSYSGLARDVGRGELLFAEIVVVRGQAEKKLCQARVGG